MPLAEQEKLTNINERIGEIGKETQEEIEQVTKEVKEAVEEGTPRPRADVVQINKSEEEKPVVIKEELEGKKIKELEEDLKEKLYHTKIENIESDTLINSLITEISEKLTDKDYKEEDIANIISDIAYRTSNGEMGTYAWLLEKLENQISEELQKKSKM